MNTLDIQDQYARAEALTAWCDAFFAAEVEEMPEDIATMFMQLSLLERQGATIPEALSNDNVGYLILTRRAKAIDLDITPIAALFLTILCQTPGNAVMYVTALRHLQVTVEEQINMAAFGNVFPNGFATPRELSRLWNMQKIEYNGHEVNLLDMIDPKKDFIMSPEEALKYHAFKEASQTA